MIRRYTLTLLYMETTKKVDLKALEKLCDSFDLEVHDLLGHVQETGHLNGKAIEHFKTMGLSV